MPISCSSSNRAEGLLSIIFEKSIDFESEWNKGNLDKSTVLYLNPSTYLYFRKNPEVIGKSDGIRFDGLLMTVALKLIGVNIIRRESFDMTSLAPKVFSRCENNNFSIFVVGGSPGEADKFINVIKQNFSLLNFSGTQDGYFDDPFPVIEKIKLTNPNLVLVGLGGRKQEKFAAHLREYFDGMIFTCGAFISQTTERPFYYPALIDRLNLRWLYRIINDKRILMRVIRTYPLFILTLFTDYREYIKTKNIG